MKLTDNMDNSIDIELPNINLVSLSKGIEFAIHEDNINKWLARTIEEETIENEINLYLYKVANALSSFLDIDLNLILGWNLEDLLDEHGQLYKSVLQKHINMEPISKNQSEIESLLLYIYNEVRKVFQSYEYKHVEKDEDYSFIHHGIKYTIPHVIRIMILGKKVHTKITVGQSVDILKIKKHLANLQGYQKDVTKKVNKVYSSYLHIIAMLALRPGEQYPEKPSEAEKFVNDRIKEFTDIKYVIANEIVFFLMRII